MPDHNGDLERRLPLVFLSPSLPRAEAEHLCAAEYRPPVRRSYGVIALFEGERMELLGPVTGESF